MEKSCHYLLAVWLPLRTLAASSLAGQGSSKDEHDQLCTAVRKPLPRCGIIDISAVQKRAVCKEIPEAQVEKADHGRGHSQDGRDPKTASLEHQQVLEAPPFVVTFNRDGPGPHASVSGPSSERAKPEASLFVFFSSQFEHVD